MTSVVETMRAFIALNLDVAAVRVVADFSRRLRAHPLAPTARWVAPTKMHVTLKFFGKIDVGLAPAIRDVMSEIADLESLLRVGLGMATAFPTPEKARVIVLEIDDASRALAQLAAAVEERLAPLGFTAEPRAFRPHVTLARTSVPVDARAWLAGEVAPSGEASATELVLYRSDLARSGAEYTAVARLGFVASRALRKGAGEN